MRGNGSDRLGKLWGAVSLLVILTTIGEASAQNSESPDVLLERLVSARQKVQNFRCTVCYHDFRPNKGESLMRALGNYGAAEKQRILSHIGNGHAYQEHMVAFDSEGRGRVELVGGQANADGTPSTVVTRNISVWDGQGAIDFVTETSREAGSAVLGDESRGLTNSSHRQPWTQFGGYFVGFMAAAIADGNAVDVQEQADGTYRVEVPCERGISRVGIVDPTQGHSVVLQEVYRGNRLLSRYTAMFRQMAPDVWFPVEGQAVSYDAETPDLIRTQTTVKVSEIKINDSNFYEGLFHVDLPEGTVVVDMVTGLQYTVGEAASLRPHGMPNARVMVEDVYTEEKRISFGSIETSQPLAIPLRFARNHPAWGQVKWRCNGPLSEALVVEASPAESSATSIHVQATVDRSKIDHLPKGYLFARVTLYQNEPTDADAVTVLVDGLN